MRPPVLTKGDFYRRFLTGEFGNRGPIWTSFREWFYDPYQGPVMLRSQKPGGLCLPGVPRPEVLFEWQRFTADDRPTISAMCPHHRQTINDELQRDHRGLCLYYSHVKEPMRQSLTKDGKQAYGITADHVLRANVYAPDYDWLMELLELYHGHVIEFTAFEIFWGVVPRSKCSVWEVRKY